MQEDIWVFGYGSLIWNPGFDVAEKQLATLSGFARRFCMRSIHYRGTAEKPGLVLALDPDANQTCTGVGFRVAAENAPDTLAYLRERELISYAYVEQWHELQLHDGRTVTAVCYVMNHDSDQYCGVLSADAQVDVISTARGSVGPNYEYLYNTVSHLHELGISDPELEKLANRVRDRLSKAD